MAGKFPTLYDLKKTAIWFSVASIGLLVGLVMMVFQDSSREWKSWERKFLEYQYEKTEGELSKVEKSVDEKSLMEAQKKLAQAQADIDSHKTEITKLESEIKDVDFQIKIATLRYQELKQHQDSDKYFYEEDRHEGKTGKAEHYKKRLDEREPEIGAAKINMETLQAQREAKDALLKERTAARDQIARDIKKITQDIDNLQRKLKSLKQTWVQGILNAPMMDFLKPSLQIQQVVVEKLKDDYYFAKVEKVDRCISCHLGIDQKGFEDAPAPFKTHPRLELFLSPDSPHPMESFGCTSCHGGSGHSVSFTTAAHTPKNQEQAEAWKKEYHWHEMHHWGEKMLPMNHIDASCAKCHNGVVNVPEAPRLNRGRELARTYGCFACHQVKGFENAWKAGPSLEHVQSKLEPDWIVRWLHNPKEFRPSTKMPRIFHLSNTSDPKSKEKSDMAIAGIAAYLIKNSDPVSSENPPKKGDPKEGEKLVNTLGCLGCHTVGSSNANDHGPELSHLGSKVKSEWLYTWLRNPKHYFPETRMPNLRLTKEQAGDIVSFLLSDHNEKFESISLPRVSVQVVEEMVLGYLAGQMRRDEARAKLEKMSPDERLEFIGKQSIGQQGCFGCHAIKGFETAKPIGTELTEEGSKDVKRFDFGFIELERTREAFFFQKLKEPRIFDQGREKPYLEKLRMPQFDFSDEEAEALTTFLLSLQKAEIPLEMRRRLNVKEEQVEAGRLLVTKLNCNGCHTLDGKEGKARALFSAKGGSASGGEDIGNAPPIIDGEGKKAQGQWLYHFLEEPIQIRPWLTYRMPTFGFDENDLNLLVEYFQNLSSVHPSFSGEKITPQDIDAGRKLFQAFQCIKCHQSNPDASLSASFLAPNLVIAKERLRPNWVLEWLKDPQALQPGTMMPAFFPEGQSPAKDILEGDATKQIKALRDYLWVFGPEEAQAISQRKAG